MILERPSVSPSSESGSRRDAMGTSTAGLAEKPELTDTPMFRVLLHDDGANGLVRVVRALQQVFDWPWRPACMVMLSAHRNGVCLCGVWPREYAEVYQDGLHAHGLLATIEPDAEEHRT
jgi:ATP-dependent Clp protease adapter protein ClpS